MVRQSRKGLYGHGEAPKGMAGQPGIRAVCLGQVRHGHVGPGSSGFGSHGLCVGAFPHATNGKGVMHLKAYMISSPEVLRGITGAVKWDRDYRKVMDFANRWDKSGAAMDVRLEIGRKSCEVVFYAGNRNVLATLYTAAAKDLAGGLEMIR